ncbi:diguanylate cyclase domain-containing protein [Thalassotalea aquiviva]|uniref:diguanylate cyclase domain-containing protein n=1 Tax=Thalassotalea aquiviva TaxID=3242415 RepID=UPI00352A61A9
MLKSKKAAAGLGLVLVGFIVLNVMAIVYYDNTRKSLQDFYQQGYIIHTTAMEVDADASAIRELLRAQAQVPKALERSKQKIHAIESNIVKNLDLMFEHYQGPAQTVAQVRHAFLTWYPLYIPENIAGSDGTNQLYQNWQSHSEVFKSVRAFQTQLLNFSLSAQKHSNQLAQQIDKGNYIVASLAIMLFLGLCCGIFYLFWLMDMLRRAERKYSDVEQLLDQNVMIATLEPTGKVLQASHSLCRYLGKTEDEVLGQNLTFFDNSDESEAHYQKITNHTQMGKVWEGQLKRKSPLGEHQWFYSRLLPNFSEDYQIKHYTNIIVDTTNNHIAMLDPLTGLGNRRRYEHSIAKALLDAETLHNHITLAIIDIDYFKPYNDFYGHPSGDTALVRVAKIIFNAVKGTRHRAFRIGGEEFAIIIYNRDQLESLKFLQLLRQTIQDAQIPHERSKVSKYLSVSIGASYRPASDTNISEDDLYQLADKALYKAKQQRNAVYISTN